MNNEPRTLLLMRHAKSAYPSGPAGPITDHDRPLAPRGVREAALAGEWLRATQPPIDGVLCSTATRTRQTLALTNLDAPVRYADRLYAATPGEVMNEIATVADDVNTLLLVGHEPTTSALALLLASIRGTNTAAKQGISLKFPTSAIAVLKVAGNWAALEPGRHALVDFHVPR
ncbi:MAG: histidine phosphatase family protein [Mycobacteriaceae bacterium]|nr:histidine phosphatase family protein [Mycobacteriaceae bacterium]